MALCGRSEMAALTSDADSSPCLELGGVFCENPLHSVDFTWHGSYCRSGSGDGNTISSLYFLLCIYL